MIRILFFVLVVFALGLGFAWLADRPGEMVITFAGYQYQVTLLVAAAGITALVAAVMLIWWLLKAVWNSPYTITRYFRVRRRDRGYQALSTGMIAAGAGDGSLARKMNKQAAKFIRADQEPLIHLLDAQASLLEGDHETARAKFEAMLDDPEMRLLGLRGLYLEAERLGDRQAARHYAGRAAEVAPQLAWASNSTLEDKAAEGDWDAALRLVDSQKLTKQIDRAAADRRRAVLLTAKAQSLIDFDVVAARNAAAEANKLAPSFVPAASTAARALLKQDDVRKGSKLIEAAWKIEPHPELAALYVHARGADGPGDRLVRAKRLQSIRQNNPDSSLAVARAALEASDYKLAREEAEAAIRMRPSEGAYLLLADVEEAESGDQGKVRQLLGRAVRAPADPAWVADGVVSEKWAPVSPVTGRVDAFEWRVPMERVGALIEDASEAVGQRAVLAAPEKVADDLIEVEPAALDQAVQATDIVPAPAPVAEAANDSAPRLPDDPGVETDEAEKDQRRFRLF
ncbi:MAG TPA: heme biosynthesis protein HemY [Rhizobiaceae bacterium]|nr:heme biosynthesis protein HemY [Rhizobiaceae bacterium]